ncbi:hypothetical protein [Rhodohalobacter sp. 614A]|uniref:hypothetical protein n=1 Tax=Rhodohalobacter sp. 614A TaxID=2908649 RepID=UPI001F1D6514|nr:hypothetical protein [Rhodohalobacter sp. 614A]
MKNIIITILIILLAKPVIAQMKTLYDGKIESGWYCSPVFKVGQINGQTGCFLGGEAVGIINHQFVIGAKGYMLVNPFEPVGLQNISVGFGGGGLLLKYIIQPNRLIHFDIESMIGAGGVYNDVKNYSKPHDSIDYTGDACFILEPGFNMVLNVTESLQVGAGATYRFTNGIDFNPGSFRHPDVSNYPILTDSDVSGISAQITILYGKF